VAGGAKARFIIEQIEVKDGCGGGDDPLKAVENGYEGIGHEMVVVDQLTGGIADTFRDTPTEGLGRTGEDLSLTGTILGLDTGVRGKITEATGFDDGDKAVADIALDGRGVLNGVDLTGPRTLEHGPETFANAGGIDDEVEGRPLLGKGLELSKYGEMVDPGPGMTLDDAVGGGLEELEGGEVDADDSEGDGITGGIGERNIVVESQTGGSGDEGFVLPGDVEEEGSDAQSALRTMTPGERDGVDEGETGRVEEGRAGIKLLVEVLGLNKGMLATVGSEDLSDMLGIGGKDLPDLFSVDLKDTPAAIALFLPEPNSDLAGEEGIAGPDGAGEEAGGVGGSGHGEELAVIATGEDVLGLIDNEKERGGIADDVGIGIAGEEGDTGTTEDAGEGTDLAPTPTGEMVVVEEVIEALDGLEGLGAVGGVDDNDSNSLGSIEIKQVCLKVEEKFVLAGLAGEDHGEGVSRAGEDGFEEGLEDGGLVGTEEDPGGGIGESKRVGKDRRKAGEVAF